MNKWDFWKWVKSFSEKKMKDSWMEGGNCDSCCPSCKQWESAGNVIFTTPLKDGAERRECGSCDHTWLAIFTPAGFVEIEDD